MATYEDIAKANETITTTPIKGKNYAEVPQRVKAFRMLYPNGTIDTQIISNVNGVVVIKATVADEGGNILATGHAYEKEGNGFINKESYIENCETSAVGRALGFMGLGIDTSICSAEELSNAILNRDKPKGRKESEEPDPNATIADAPKAVSKVKGMIATLNDMGATTFMDELKQMYGIEKVEDIKKGDYNTIMQLGQSKYEMLKEAE
jgi:hypothetical protein